jgi:hypothetical protein
MSDLVALTEAELWKLQQLTLARQEVKGAKNVATKKFDPSQSDFKIAYEGLTAEYAVAKFFGEPFDMRILLGGDGGVQDLYVGDLRVQVKYSKRGLLYFNSLPDFAADVAILVSCPQPGWCELEGVISRAKFLKSYEQMDFGFGPRVGVKKASLSPARSLLSYKNGGAA